MTAPLRPAILARAREDKQNGRWGRQRRKGFWTDYPLLDQVGADRVVLGSDWPFVPWDPSPVAWVPGLKALTQDEKEKMAPWQ